LSLYQNSLLLKKKKEKKITKRSAVGLLPSQGFRSSLEQENLFLNDTAAPPCGWREGRQLLVGPAGCRAEALPRSTQDRSIPSAFWICGVQSVLSWKYFFLKKVLHLYWTSTDILLLLLPKQYSIVTIHVVYTQH
jgi:hypothetical protein